MVVKHTDQAEQNHQGAALEHIITTNRLLRCSKHVVTDGVYCAQCHLFAGPDARVKALVTTVLRDWSNISKVVLSHMKSDANLSNCDSADHHSAIMKGEKKTYYVACHPNTMWLLKRTERSFITEAIVFCGKQNIALRKWKLAQHANSNIVE
ncbi:LOW QUALITY PROTEIN: hypothetical protein MAR_036718, partial [Mya arenaria]